MKFAYIGLKTDGERAFREKTGIEWMPGSAHDVTDADVCAEMLKHPTIWKPVGKADVSLAGAKNPLAFNGPLTDDDVTDAEDVAKKDKLAAATAATQAQNTGDPFAGMDDKAVRAYAKDNGVSFQGIGALKGEKLHAKVLAALDPKK